METRLKCVEGYVKEKLNERDKMDFLHNNVFGFSGYERGGEFSGYERTEVQEEIDKKEKMDIKNKENNKEIRRTRIHGYWW